MVFALPFITGNPRCLFKMFNLRITAQQFRSTQSTSNGQQEKSLDIPADMPDEGVQNPYQREKVQCILCRMKVTPDYKNVRLLSQFISPYTGRIYGRHITRLCKKQQAKVVREITKAQNAGFMAYYLKDVAFLKDCKLYDPNQPIRPHRF